MLSAHISVSISPPLQPTCHLLATGNRRAPLNSPRHLGLFSSSRIRAYLVLHKGITSEVITLKRPRKAQFFAIRYFYTKPHSPSALLDPEFKPPQGGSPSPRASTQSSSLCSLLRHCPNLHSRENAPFHPPMPMLSPASQSSSKFAIAAFTFHALFGRMLPRPKDCCLYRQCQNRKHILKGE